MTPVRLMAGECHRLVAVKIRDLRGQGLTQRAIANDVKVIGM